MNSKPWYQSVTVYVNLLMAVLSAAFPEYVSNHPELSGSLAALVNILVRLFLTTRPLSVGK